MTPPKSWGSPTSLQNLSQFSGNQNIDSTHTIGRPVPILPPRPITQRVNSINMPYSYPSSYNSPYGSYGNFGSAYRNSLYGPYRSSYGEYNNNYNMYDYSSFPRDDYERRFIQSAEESSRQTFASLESVIRAFNSLAMMLDNTFFAMTSSFRAILGVAENFGLSVSRSPTHLAWKEATCNGSRSGSPSGSNWSALAFLGVIVSAPYIISKFLPKYEDKLDPANWKTPGIRAKACFDFIATSPNELTIHTNDNIILAPSYLQEEMNLRNTGWAYAIQNDKSGVIPLNYIIINKNVSLDKGYKSSLTKEGSETILVKNNPKKVSFGDIQIFESEDIPLEQQNLPAESSSGKKVVGTDN